MLDLRTLRLVCLCSNMIFKSTNNLPLPLAENYILELNFYAKNIFLYLDIDFQLTDNLLLLILSITF